MAEGANSAGEIGLIRSQSVDLHPIQEVGGIGSKKKDGKTSFKPEILEGQLKNEGAPNKLLHLGGDKEYKEAGKKAI